MGLRCKFGFHTRKSNSTFTPVNGETGERLEPFDMPVCSGFKAAMVEMAKRMGLDVKKVRDFKLKWEKPEK